MIVLALKGRRAATSNVAPIKAVPALVVIPFADGNKVKAAED